MTLSLGEILEGSKGLTTEEALNYLKKNKSKPLWGLLKETLEPESYDREVLNTTWKNNPSHLGLAENHLYSELRRFYIFKKSSTVDLKRKKIIFSQIMESLHQLESSILLSIVSGTFYNRYTNLNPNDIRNLITLT